MFSKDLNQVRRNLNCCKKKIFFFLFKGTRSLSDRVNENSLDQIDFETAATDKIENDNLVVRDNNQVDGAKDGFKVLLIYTYDCEEHFNVVKAFSHFLREVSNQIYS